MNVGIIHKYVRDIYTKRFPELESLIEYPFDYIRTVQRLGNELDVPQVKFNATRRGRVDIILNI